MHTSRNTCRIREWGEKYARVQVNATAAQDHIQFAVDAVVRLGRECDWQTQVNELKREKEEGLIEARTPCSLVRSHRTYKVH